MGRVIAARLAPAGGQSDHPRTGGRNAWRVPTDPSIIALSQDSYRSSNPKAMVSLTFNSTSCSADNEPMCLYTRFLSRASN